MVLSSPKNTDIKLGLYSNRKEIKDTETPTTPPSPPIKKDTETPTTPPSPPIKKDTEIPTDDDIETPKSDEEKLEYSNQRKKLLDTIEKVDVWISSAVENGLFTNKNEKNSYLSIIDNLKSAKNFLRKVI